MVKIHGLAPRAAWLKSMIWHPVPHGKNMAWHPVPHVTTGLDASPTIDRRLLIGSRQWPEQQLKTPIVKPVSYPFCPKRGSQSNVALNQFWTTSTQRTGKAAGASSSNHATRR